MNCARVETKIGESQKRFEDKISRDIITPLKAFLEVDIKTIQVGGSMDMKIHCMGRRSFYMSAGWEAFVGWEGLVIEESSSEWVVERAYG